MKHCSADPMGRALKMCDNDGADGGDHFEVT